MHGPLNRKELQLIRKLPQIRRIRGHYLYDAHGKRWADFWLDGGGSITGHKPAGLCKRLKNELERGLIAAYPGHWEQRLKTVLLKLFPSYSYVKIYSNVLDACSELGLASLPDDPLDFPETSADISESKKQEFNHKALWTRPLLPNIPLADYLFPILPIDGLGTVQPVLFRKNFPQGEDPLYSPILLAALTRAALMYGAIQESNMITDIPHEKLILWKRRGCYFMYKGNQGDYPEVFESLFSRHILVSPSPFRPCIVYPGVTGKELELFLNGGNR